MPTNGMIETFAATDIHFKKVLAGKMSIEDFFTNKQYDASKNNFIRIYETTFGQRPAGSLYNDESVAAAWITKLRYNQHLTDQQFLIYINKSDEIFKGNVKKYDLTTKHPENNDLCALMWGIEAFNGIQSFDRGVTRVRLPEGVAPQIIKSLEEAKAVSRANTHAHCTRLVDKGLGKDIENEELRAYTPRGMGTVLAIPTSQNGQGGLAKSCSAIQKSDYDLLLKRENFGYNDVALHTLKHLHVGFINKLLFKQQQKESSLLTENKSELALNAEVEMGKGKRVHRKEHLTELKQESKILLTLFEAGKKEGLFSDFKTTWSIRIKIPPWEVKIVSNDSNNRQGLGCFIKQLAQAETSNPDFAQRNSGKFETIKKLLAQATEEKFGAFQQCREGNEVLVNCESGKALLVASIAKGSDNTPVNRTELIPLGIVSEVNPASISRLDSQKNLKVTLSQIKETHCSNELSEQATIPSPSKF